MRCFEIEKIVSFLEIEDAFAEDIKPSTRQVNMFSKFFLSGIFADRLAMATDDLSDLIGCVGVIFLDGHLKFPIAFLFFLTFHEKMNVFQMIRIIEDFRDDHHLLFYFYDE